MPGVAVVIPARDSATTIGQTLAALTAQVAEFDYEVVVVDDGSSDETPSIVEQAGPRVRLVAQEGLGAAAARNRGVSETGAELLAFCDADCYPTETWLATGLQALERSDIVQGKVIPDPEAEIGPFDRTLGVMSEYGLYETANMFVRREIFELVGGFQPVVAFGGGGVVTGEAAMVHRDGVRPFGEDTWFAWRAKRSGARSAFAADAVVHHAVFPRDARDYVVERQRTRYFPSLVALIPELREQLLSRGLFLTNDTARFDLGVLALVCSALSRRWLPAAIGFLPYTAELGRKLRGRPRTEAARLAAAYLAADAVTFASLVRGSIGARTLVL